MLIVSRFGNVLSLAAVNSTTWSLGEARGTMMVIPGQIWRLVIRAAVPWTLNGSALAFSNDGARTWTMVAFPSGRG